MTSSDRLGESISTTRQSRFGRPPINSHGYVQKKAQDWKLFRLELGKYPIFTLILQDFCINLNLGVLGFLTFSDQSSKIYLQLRPNLRQLLLIGNDIWLTFLTCQKFLKPEILENINIKHLWETLAKLVGIDVTNMLRHGFNI